MRHTLQIPIVMVGNVLYHFDRALFGLLVPFLAPIFFPEQDPIYALILMFTITPLTLLAKPLGAIIFGYFGDRYGTQKILSITLLGMAVKTCCMGFLPTYERVGTLAPILLAFTRMMIGFFSAGETTGGAIALFETSQAKKRNLMSALYDASGILGVLLASFFIWLFHSYEDFWRMLFWSGSLVGLLGWFMRKSSNERVEKKMQSPSPFKTIWTYRKIVIKVALLSGFSYANYYLITNFMNGFLPIVSDISKGDAIALNTSLLTLDFLLLPLFGILSLKISKERLIFLSILGIMLVCGPMFYFLQTPTPTKVAFVRIFLMIFGVVLAAPYHAWVYENTPKDHRYLIGAFSTALGGRLFGSPILPVGLWLYHKTNLIIAPVIPLLGLGCLTLFALYRNLKKPKQVLAKI